MNGELRKLKVRRKFLKRRLASGLKGLEYKEALREYYEVDNKITDLELNAKLT